MPIGWLLAGLLLVVTLAPLLVRLVIISELVCALVWSSTSRRGPSQQMYRKTCQPRYRSDSR